MRAFAFITVIFAAAFSCSADPANSLERFSPHFTTNTEIRWQATNRLPESFWIYKRLPPRPFLASVISNAVILASMQDKGFPKPSTNAFYIWSAPDPCMSFSIFSIQPASTAISFSSPNQSLSTNDVPDDETVTKRAFECAARFGLDRAHLIPKDVYTASNAPAGCADTLANDICARGIYLSRRLDGVGFFPTDIAEGFSIEFGSHGQIRSFALVWPNLEPHQKSLTASPEEIIHCIREQRVLVLPDDDEPNYFRRIKSLAGTRTFTITKITPCYGDFMLGEVPANDVPPELIIPVAELEAVAGFGNSNVTVRLVSPILSSEVGRLLGNKSKYRLRRTPPSGGAEDGQ
jgi:hypothetical protein